PFIKGVDPRYHDIATAAGIQLHNYLVSLDAQHEAARSGGFEYVSFAQDGKVEDIPPGAMRCLSGDCYIEKIHEAKIGEPVIERVDDYVGIDNDAPGHLDPIGKVLSVFPNRLAGIAGSLMQAEKNPKMAAYKVMHTYQFYDRTYQYTYPDDASLNYRKNFRERDLVLVHKASTPYKYVNPITLK
ncbi:MAG: hypothetical protein KTR20_14610, partial [Cellvibrionaceae bacterium]|nr:hypothetical protein [Cellvibrionaceae bacterium]